MIEPKPHDSKHGALPQADALARAAVEDIQSGMIVGLGTGRNSDRAIRALADRLRTEKLDIDCICTSKATEALAVELGLPVVPFDEIEEVDYLFDGAYEVDRGMRMLKGLYGAITRQRLVAQVARRRVYITAEERLSDRLGAKAPLTITIIPFGIASIRNRLRDMGLIGVPRHNLDGSLFMSDGGGVVLDLRMPERDPRQLAEELDHVTGVVDHGIFLDEADTILLECKGGEVKRMDRED
ncbi:MAG: ribose 5-phosphate isomerase A [Phycisphaerales bacterium]